MPDAEENPSESASYAQFAAIAVCCLVDAVAMTRRGNRVALVAEQSVNMIDLYVQVTEPETALDAIAEHQLMQREMSRQERDIQQLARLGDSVTREAVDGLRSRAKSERLFA